MRILISGASGFIGVWLVRDLLAAGHEVVAIDRQEFDEPRLEFIGGEFEFYQGNFGWFLHDKLNIYDVIIPLQGQIGSVDSIKEPAISLSECVWLNLELLERVIKTKRKPLVIFISSDLCYGEDSKCIYSLHKKVMEGYLRIFNEIYGMQYVILRMATGYGPWQKRDSVVNFFIRRALENKTVPVYGDGQNRRAFIYIEDASKCIAEACEGKLDSGTYPLIGENLSILEVAEIVVDVIGGEVEHVEWPHVTKAVDVGDMPIDLPSPWDRGGMVKMHEGIVRTAEWIKSTD